MFVIYRKDTQVVVDVVDTCERSGSNLFVTKPDQVYSYADGDSLLFIELSAIPLEVEPLNYLFDGINFSVNKNYTAPPQENN